MADVKEDASFGHPSTFIRDEKRGRLSDMLALLYKIFGSETQYISRSYCIVKHVN